MDDFSPAKASKYALYVRKSQDDPQKQVRSIDDQIKECLNMADNLELNVINRSNPFHEEVSAKRPDKRPKFNELLEKIKKGEITGVLAWHPDRLARNMIEGGRIIQLLDEGKLIDLKFVSHPFTNDAGGKLLLGISFALSKHYSDKLSEDVSRGIKGNLKDGISGGHYKAGYYRNPESGYYHPDDKNFSIIKKAWEMKLKGEAEKTIVKTINVLGYKRLIKKKNPRVKPVQYMSEQKLNIIFSDPIYYGVLQQSDIKIELCEIYDFVPMVTEDEFTSVQKKRKNYIKETVKHNFPFRGLIICNLCKNKRRAAASKGRSGDKFLYYRCDTDGCNEYGKGIRTKIIIEALYDALQNSILWEKISEPELKIVIRKSVDRKLTELNIEIQMLNAQHTKWSNELEELLDNYIKNGERFDKSEREHYKKRKLLLNGKVNEVKKSLKKRKMLKERSVLDVKDTLNHIKRAAESFNLGDAAKKDSIAKTMFLNLHVEGSKVLTIKRNPDFGDFLLYRSPQDGGPGWT